MSDYYMGQELNLPELPVNSPRPPETPLEGIIVVDHDADGFTRRYLYKAMGGQVQEEVLLSAVPDSSSMGCGVIPEIPSEEELQETQQIEAPSRMGMPVYDARRSSPNVSPVGAPISLMEVPGGMPSSVPVAGDIPQGRALGVQNLFQNQKTVQPSSVPLMGANPVNTPMHSIPMPERTGLGGPTSFLQKQVSVKRGMLPTMGQVAPPAGPVPTGAGAAPPAPAGSPTPGECPGPIEMPDGKIIQPPDSVTLKDLCELFPFLLDAYKVAKGGAGGPAPGQSIPISQSGMQALAPNPGVGGFPSQGPSTGSFGGGGGSRLGQLTPGPRVQVGPGSQGGSGPQGPEGPAGSGGGLVPEFLIKADGDFVAGPGSFVAVPGTLLNFSTAQDGGVVFILQAVLGCGVAAPQNGVVGLRIDGVDRQLNPRILQTMGSTVVEYFLPVNAHWTQFLNAGAHTVEVILRGCAAGEFCSAAGLGVSTTISGNTDVPLCLTVMHEGTTPPSPGATVLGIDGLVKTDGNFFATGGLTAVPGMGFNFTMQRAGMAQFSFSAVLTGLISTNFPNVQVGLRVDGTDYTIWSAQEQQGSGQDKVFKMTSGGSLPLSLSAGSHSVQVVYTSLPGASQMDIETSPTQPGTLSVIHP